MTTPAQNRMFHIGCRNGRVAMAACFVFVGFMPGTCVGLQHPGTKAAIRHDGCPACTAIIIEPDDHSQTAVCLAEQNGFANPVPAMLEALRECCPVVFVIDDGTFRLGWISIPIDPAIFSLRQDVANLKRS